MDECLVGAWPPVALCLADGGRDCELMVTPGGEKGYNNASEQLLAFRMSH